MAPKIYVKKGREEEVCGLWMVCGLNIFIKGCLIRTLGLRGNTLEYIFAVVLSASTPSPNLDVCGSGSLP